PYLHAWTMYQLAHLPGGASVSVDFSLGMFSENNRGTRIADVLDGTSRTIAIGETRQERSGLGKPSWGAARMGGVSGAMRDFCDLEPGSLRINAKEADGLPPDFGFGSWHPGGANFLFADGSVQFLRNNIAFPVYDALGTIRGNENLNWE